MTYVIRETRQYYAPGQQDRTLVTGSDNRAMVFETRKDAQAWINQHDEEIYRLGHNESGRPAFKIFRMDRLPEYLTYQV